MDVKPRKRPRKRRSRRSPPRSVRRPRWVWVLLALGIGFCVAVGGLCVALWRWAATPQPRTGYTALTLSADSDTSSVVASLVQKGLVAHPGLTWTARQVFFPRAEFAAGEHWLPNNASVRDLLRSLVRERGRPSARVTFPEGWDSFQMAERLASSGICSSDAFLHWVHDPIAARARIGEPSLEGYLYPATYELLLDSAPEAVGERLLREAEQRFDAVLEANSERAAQLEREFGLSEAGLVAFASIVQKEAADRDEYGLISSVFLNRLADPAFRPRRTLQSDPTALYGCKRYPELDSCRTAAGRVAREILRDASNPFNTYKNSGLPPGPIGNPSSDVLSAVLRAPATDFLFFFAPRGGRHTFSRSLAEHNAAIGRSSPVLPQ